MEARQPTSKGHFAFKMNTLIDTHRGLEIHRGSQWAMTCKLPNGRFVLWSPTIGYYEGLKAFKEKIDYCLDVGDPFDTKQKKV